MSNRAISLLVALSLAACTKNLAKGQNGLLFVTSDVPAAEVWLNETFIGEVGEAKGGIRLPVGTYRLELRHNDYHSEFRIVTIDSKSRVKLSLNPARRY